MRRGIVIAIVIAGCKGSAPAPPPTPSASASAAASGIVDVEAGGPVASAEGDASVADEAGGDDAGTAVAGKDGSPMPPLAKGAAWSIVRWDMSRADVEDAFKKAGVNVEGKNDAKTGAERVTVRHGPWSGVVYFSAKKPTNIVVTGERLTKEAASQVGAKMKERGGAPAQTMDRLEVRWRKAGGGATTVVVANDGTVREEYVREGATGNVGLATLTWGMAPAAAQQALVASGYAARPTKSSGGLDPCTLPNAPPDCDKKKGPAESLVITKGDASGKASFDAKGLTQLELSGSSTDKGVARLAELEKSLGKPTTRERSTKTQHADDVAKIELEVKAREPEGTFTVFENYRPRK
jgi:hypothetical protein